MQSFFLEWYPVPSVLWFSTLLFRQSLCKLRNQWISSITRSGPDGHTRRNLTNSLPFRFLGSSSSRCSFIIRNNFLWFI